MPRSLTLLLILLPWVARSAPTAPLRPAEVIVLYNSAVPESIELAANYCVAREIPEENLVGLDLPDQDQITRQQYRDSLAAPLLAEMERRRWIQLGDQPEVGRIIRGTNHRVFAIMKGVPRMIAPEGEGAAQPLQENHASVDSELACLGLTEVPPAGPVRNPYYQADASFRTQPLAPIFLVGRLDGPDYETATRLFRDAIEVEARGLWGHCYVDQDDQYSEGTAWLTTVATEAGAWGFPVIAEPTTETFPVNYPMQHCALYYGWYDHNFSGPLRNAQFRFLQGAIAVHIHSFSAASLAADANWCGPILAHGAAATLGHVYEPYLSLTHHLDLFHNRLVQGYSFAEAAQMSLPGLSWMWTNLGDPLYRPFAAQAALRDEDYLADDEFRPWRTLRLLSLSQPAAGPRLDALRDEAGDDPVLLEALASAELSRGNDGVNHGRAALERATAHYPAPRDQLRCRLEIALLDQVVGRTHLAVDNLQQLRIRYGNLPESLAAQAMLDRIQPPAPPQVE